MALYGWIGRMLRVDLAKREITKEDRSECLRKFIGGRGASARMAWEEIPPGIDAYDPKNKLIFMTGPLTGTLAPTSGGRITVCGIAPQAYPKPHYTRSNLGGYWGAELKYAGYDGVIIQGKADNPSYITILNEEVRIESAEKLWGLDTFATQKILLEKYGPNCKVLCIGPAGENLVRIATIQSSIGNAAGQGGFGAVMGSKNLKAIVVRGTGKIRIAEPKKFLEVCKYIQKLIHFHRDVSEKELRIRRTCTMSCTAKNCPDSFVLHKNVPGKYYPFAYTGVLQCASHAFTRFKPWEVGFEAAQLANMYGINHWEIVLGYGGIGGWLRSCVNAGLFSEKDFGMPLDLEDGKFWCELIRKIAYKEGIGEALSEGVPRAADILGKGHEYLPHVAHGFETHWDGHFFGAPCFPYWIVSALMWAMDSRDPMCHGYAQEITWWWDRFGGPLKIEQIIKVGEKIYGSPKATDPESGYEYKVQPTIWHQNRLCIKDSLLVCDQVFPILFSRYSEDGYGDTGAEAKLFSTATGICMSEQELDRIGERILNLERAIMVMEGRSRRDDESVIPYFRRPDYEGVPLDEKKFLKLMDELYELRGWDKATGWPKIEKLKELELNDVASVIKKLQNRSL